MSSVERQLADAAHEDRVRRALALPRVAILPASWVARVQADCRRLFIEGHFFGCILACIAAVDGLSKYVATRRLGAVPRGDFLGRIKRMQERGTLDTATASAFRRVWGSNAQRNAFVHANACMEQMLAAWESRATECVVDLHAIETRLFASRTANGRLLPEHAELWECGDVPGTVRAFLDCL